MSEERQQGEERRQAEEPGGETPANTGQDNQNVCPECGGSGKIDPETNCPNCGGTGKVAAVGY